MFNSPRRYKLSILALAVAAWPLSGAAKACENWDLGDSFKLTQANGAFVSVHGVEVSGSRIEGSARHDGIGGDLAGTLNSDGRFKFTIEWDDGPVGVYTAHVSESGAVLDGRTYDETNPSSWSTWKMRPISCND